MQPNGCAEYATRMIKERGGVPSMPISPLQPTVVQFIELLNDASNVFTQVYGTFTAPISNDQARQAFSEPSQPPLLIIMRKNQGGQIVSHVVACIFQKAFQKYFIHEGWADEMTNSFPLETGNELQTPLFKTKYRGFVVMLIISCRETRKGKRIPTVGIPDLPIIAEPPKRFGEGVNFDDWEEDEAEAGAGSAGRGFGKI